MSSNRNRINFTRNRLISLFTIPSISSYNIPSFSPLQNSNAELCDIANPPLSKRKRKTLIPRLFRANASDPPSSLASTSTRRSPWAQWRYRRWTARPSDRMPYSKVDALPTQTTEADQKSRFKILKSSTKVRIWCISLSKASYSCLVTLGTSSGEFESNYYFSE